MSASVSPARKQYLEFKRQYPDAILMYQVGDFYETFDEDAYIASRELQIVRTARSYNKGQERVPLAGIPLHALDNYVGKLIQRGYKVVICDQLGSQPEKGKDVVERAVTRILTAGTLSEPDLLPARQNNYLVAIAVGRTQTALAAVDVSTGEFMVTWFDQDVLPLALDAELQRLVPAECLLVAGSDASAFHFPTRTVTITHCAPSFFQPESARTRLCRLFSVQSLDAYGCADVPSALAAAGALVAYLEKMNVSLLPLLTSLRSYSTETYMQLDAHTQQDLELLRGTRSGEAQGSLLHVLDQTVTPMGARLMRRTITQPLLDLSELDRRQTAIDELYQSPVLRSRIGSLLQESGDIERIAARIHQGTAVRNEVLGLREYLESIPRLREVVCGSTSPLLLDLAHSLDACPAACDLIQRALAPAGVEDENGDHGRLIRFGYHAELDELFASIRSSRRWMASLEAQERQRTGIKSLRVSFNKVFGYYIEVTNTNLSLVPADYQRKQTLVNAERFITPGLKEHEARIVSANERIEEMERAIYADLMQRLTHSCPQLSETASAVAWIDVLLSLAELAVRQRYVRPVLEQGYCLDIQDGRHPVVEQMLDGDVFIPNTTHLQADQGERLLLLTGPNMAGKSTYLRQVALITLLAQIGSFVPARSARIGLVDRIFTRVGAEDDIASGKSTFFLEMEETATILHHATAHSLLILDEIGRGTSTYDGLAVARAVLEYLHDSVQARTLFATHYHELAVLATELKHLGVYTVAISEDEDDRVVFLHRVVPGSIGKSYGIHVARLASMPSSVIARAQVLLHQLERGGMSQQKLSSPPGEQESSKPRLPRKRGLLRDPGALYASGQFIWSHPHTHEWQSDEARFISVLLERDDSLEEVLAEVDLQVITPLDALNLLFAMQKRQSQSFPLEEREAAVQAGLTQNKE